MRRAEDELMVKTILTEGQEAGRELGEERTWATEPKSFRREPLREPAMERVQSQEASEE